MHATKNQSSCSPTAPRPTPVSDASVAALPLRLLDVGGRSDGPPPPSAEEPPPPPADDAFDPDIVELYEFAVLYEIELRDEPDDDAEPGRDDNGCRRSAASASANRRRADATRRSLAAGGIRRTAAASTSAARARVASSVSAVARRASTAWAAVPLNWKSSSAETLLRAPEA